MSKKEELIKEIDRYVALLPIENYDCDWHDTGYSATGDYQAFKLGEKDACCSTKQIRLSSGSRLEYHLCRTVEGDNCFFETFLIHASDDEFKGTYHFDRRANKILSELDGGRIYRPNLYLRLILLDLKAMFQVSVV